MQCLEYRHIVAVFRHVTGKSQARRTRTDNGNFLAVLFRSRGQTNLSLFALSVGYKTLQITDGNGFLAHFVVDTLCLALFLLRAYASAHGG